MRKLSFAKKKFFLVLETLCKLCLLFKDSGGAHLSKISNGGLLKPVKELQINGVLVV